MAAAGVDYQTGGFVADKDGRVFEYDVKVAFEELRFGQLDKRVLRAFLFRKFRFVNVYLQQLALGEAVILFDLAPVHAHASTADQAVDGGEAQERQTLAEQAV